MNNLLILALDIGTSSIRACLYGDNGDPIPQASAIVEHSFAAVPGGGSEIDADEGFDHVVAAIDAVLRKGAKIKGDIAFVASCSFWHSVVGVDANGKPTTKVLGWADTRSGEYSRVLKKRFDETEIHNRTGSRLHSSYWPAKLLWLRKESPGVFAKTARWLSFSDYVALRLFGEAATSISMASGTGIFDIRKCEWDTKLLKYLMLNRSNLPAIAGLDTHTFTLTKAFAQRWPQLKHAKWFPAIGDGGADNIGAGCVTKTKAALMVGTSGAMRIAYAGEPPKKIPAGLWCYRIDRKRVVIGGALSDGGGLYEWLRKNLKLPDDAEALIGKPRPDRHGLTFLPFLAGERGTGYHEHAAGVVLGLTSATDPVDILQAALESVAYRFAEIFEQLNRVANMKEIVASGGALRDSSVWTQIIADVLGRDLLTNDFAESSSRGAVVLALERIGTIMNIETFPKVGEGLVEADLDRFASYKIARKRHADLYKLLIQ